MPGVDVVVIGFSAGGVEALTRLVQGLPAELPAAIFVAHHFPPESISALPSIITRLNRLPAQHPADGELIQLGRIYVAPPDRHLLLDGARIKLSRGPKENGSRPAIDPLFRTAARSFGRRVAAVLLSGTLDDGVAGMATVKRYGGTTIAQDPDDAAYAGMPASAIRHVGVDHVAPAAAIGPLLARLIGEAGGGPQQGGFPMPANHLDPPDPAERGTRDLEEHRFRGPPSELTCPECGGAVWEEEGGVLEYRCHVGHRFTGDAMLASQSDALEIALWSAVRSLQEKGELARRLAERATAKGHHRSARQFQASARDAQRASEAIRELLLGGVTDSPTREGAHASGDFDETAEPLSMDRTS